MRHECYLCHRKTIEKLLAKFRPEPEVADRFIKSVHKILDDNTFGENPYLSAEIHRIARKSLNHTDLFKKEKKEANDTLLELYPYWQDIIHRNGNPLYTAAKLAVIGNIIDYGAHTVGDDIVGQVKSFLSQDLKIDETVDLFREAEKAESILYIGDNAGEIVFDKLFIETLGPNKITYAVRGTPVINDVTEEDARQCGLDKTCRVISNGNDAPSTLLDLCSNEFLEAFDKADLIISKGQGNFEGLMGNSHPDLFFLLIAKCNPVANVLGVNPGDMVITRLKN